MPADARGQYHYDPRELTVDLPPAGVSARNLLILVGASAALAGVACLGAWLKLDPQLAVWAGAAAASACAGVFGWSLLKSSRQETRLIVSPEEITIERHRSDEHRVWTIRVDDLRDVSVVGNVGPMAFTDAECIWLGREAVAFTCSGQDLAFGMGMSRAELDCVKAAVDRIIGGAETGASDFLRPGDPMEQVREMPAAVSTVASGRLRVDLRFVAAWVVLTALVIGGHALGRAIGINHLSPDEPVPATATQPVFSEEDIEAIREAAEFVRRMRATSRPAAEETGNDE